MEEKVSIVIGRKRFSGVVKSEQSTTLFFDLLKVILEPESRRDDRPITEVFRNIIESEKEANNTEYPNSGEEEPDSDEEALELLADKIKDTDKLPVDDARISKNDITGVPSLSGYKGLLYIRCECCGEEKGFFAKEPITAYTCNSCGVATELNFPLDMAFSHCPNCSNRLYYRTNISDDKFTMRCHNCGGEIDLKYNERHKKYETM